MAPPGARARRWPPSEKPLDRGVLQKALSYEMKSYHGVMAVPVRFVPQTWPYL